MSQRVRIVGAGLAGLSAGIVLTKAGHEVRILDLDARVDGASIGISARAIDSRTVGSSSTTSKLRASDGITASPSLFPCLRTDHVDLVRPVQISVRME